MKTTEKKAETQKQIIQSKATKQASENSILQNYKANTTQLKSSQEEELLQGKFDTLQLRQTAKGLKTLEDAKKLRVHLSEKLEIKDKSHAVHGKNYDSQGDSPESILSDLLKTVHSSLIENKQIEGDAEILQLKPNAENKINQVSKQADKPHQLKSNNTGLPDNLKSGIENLSGYSMDDVNVHYNSSQPSTLQAHAYAQGTDIHIAPGQEKHLAHEAWHVVQQKQGRVQPTKQLKGTTNINDDAGLEKEADVMGGKALQFVNKDALNDFKIKSPSRTAVQMVAIRVKTSQDAFKVVNTNSEDLETLKLWLSMVVPEDKDLLMNEILEKWKQRVKDISNAHTQIGPKAGMPAAYDKIELGPFRQKNPYEVSNRDQMDPVSIRLGMDRKEEEALYRYSQGAKDEKDSPGYMDDESWEKLGSAVTKIPSMLELGEVATVFRADRKADFTKFLMSRIGKPCYIEHGAKSTKAGIPHLASAAFTVNSHGMREEEVKGKGMQLGKPQKLALTRIICVSARYIQYWGMHGASLDGGEVLIPAGTITYYDGEHPNTEPFGEVNRQIFTLVEVTKEQQRAKPLPVFDDFRGDVA